MGRKWPFGRPQSAQYGGGGSKFRANPSSPRRTVARSCSDQNSARRGSFCMLGSSSPINYGSKVAVRTVSERSIWWWWVEISSQSELAAPYSGQILATHHTLRPQLLQLTPNSHHDHQLPPSFHRFSSKDRLRSCSSGTSWRHSWCGVVRCANHAAFSSGIIHAGEFDARFCRPEVIREVVPHMRHARSDPDPQRQWVLGQGLWVPVFGKHWKAFHRALADCVTEGCVISALGRALARPWSEGGCMRG